MAGDYLESCQLYLEVAEDNDHLGLVVSGIKEESKNVDKNIESARKSLFNFLGNIFAYKCKLSYAVQLHFVIHIRIHE